MDLGENASGGMGGGAFSQFGGSGSTPRGFQPVISSGPDSIEVGGGEKKSRKWVVVLIAVLVFAAVGAGVFVVLNSGSNGNYDALSSILENKREAVEATESFFDHVYYGDISFEMVYQVEGAASSLDQLISPVKELGNELGTIKKSGFNDTVKNLFESLVSDIDKSNSVYSEMNKIYTAFYDVYHSDDSKEKAKALLNSDDQYIADLAPRFVEYYSRKSQLLSDIEKNGCGSWFEFTDVCTNLYNDYYDNDDFMTNGEILAGVMNKIVPPEEYNSISQKTNLIGELLYDIGEMKK